MDNKLTHHGILGMKWGVRRTQAQLGHLTKKDNKLVKKNSDKVTAKARKKSSRDLAKRGEVGVFMALADQGYNMNQLKNGIFDSGKIAYKNTVVDKVENQRR